MIKKAALILLAVIMLAAFCGCQLAVEGKGTGGSNDLLGPGVSSDMLCGMLITFDYIDNTDWNAVLNGTGSAGSMDGGKIYAAQKTDEHGNADFVFEGIDGIRFFQVFIPGDGERNGYSKSYNDSPLLSDVKQGINITDTGKDISLEGTMYLCVNPDPQKETGDFSVYCNPVYETQDGRLYMVPGTGHSMYDPTSGLESTTALSGEATWTMGGETKKWSAEAKLTVKAIDYIQKYVFKEMDAQDKVVSVLEITEDSIPEEIRLSGNTAYVILETWSLDNNGKTATQRSIVDFSKQSINVMFPTQSGLAEGYGITLTGIPSKS